MCISLSALLLPWLFFVIFWKKVECFVVFESVVRENFRERCIMSDNSNTSLENQILEHVSAPKVVDIDGQRVEQFSIDDLEKAVKLAASVKASRSRSLGIRRTKMIAGGAE